MNEVPQIIVNTEVNPLMVVATLVMAIATVGLLWTACELNKITKQIGGWERDYYDKEYLSWVLDNAPRCELYNFKITRHSDGRQLSLSGNITNKRNRPADLPGVLIEGQLYSCRCSIDNGNAKKFDGSKDLFTPEFDLNVKTKLEVKLYYTDDYGYKFMSRAVFKKKGVKYELQPGTYEFRPFKPKDMRAIFLSDEE